jgi:hypothetical protein
LAVALKLMVAGPAPLAGPEIVSQLGSLEAADHEHEAPVSRLKLPPPPGIPSWVEEGVIEYAHAPACVMLNA